jgi:hypothetical protein
MAVNVKAALLSYRQQPTLTDFDRAHIDRWLAEASNPVWQIIVENLEATGEIPPIEGGIINLVIGSALRARKHAESARYETIEIKKQRQIEAQKQRENFVSLASDIEEVVKKVRAFRTAMPPDPNPNSSRELEARRSLEWLEAQAKLLRRRAAPPSSHSQADDWEFVPTRARRQSGGRGRRTRTRELGVFMAELVNFMHSYFGKPQYEFVASLTNVAFQDADIGAEEVRQYCRRPRNRYTQR